MDFMTHIQTKKQETEIQTETISPVCCYAFTESGNAEQRFIASFSHIVLECPYISGIDEYSSGKLPDYIKPIFDIGLQLPVTGLFCDDL